MNNDGFVDDPRVVGALADSVLLAAVRALVLKVWNAIADSRACVVVAGFVNRWRAHSSSVRARELGVMLLVASTTHLLLIAAHEVPAGWLWLTLPGMAASVGLGLVGAGRAGAVSQ